MPNHIPKLGDEVTLKTGEEGKVIDIHYSIESHKPYLYTVDTFNGYINVSPSHFEWPKHVH